MTVRFDNAWNATYELAKDAADRTGLDVVLVRDLLGRVSLVVDDRTEALSSGVGLADLARQLAERAGPFTAPAPVTVASKLFMPEQILRARDLITVQQRSGRTGAVSILERGVMGAEWLHPRDEVPSNRVALYGFKGEAVSLTLCCWTAERAFMTSLLSPSPNSLTLACYSLPTVRKRGTATVRSLASGVVRRNKPS